jgi:hypothetical protein
MRRASVVANRVALCALLCCAGVLRVPGAVQADDGRVEARPRDHELSVVPFAGGTSDLGIGIGALAAFESYAPDVQPYRHRVEASGLLTFKLGVGGSPIVLPYQDGLLQWTWFLSRDLRLLLRATYTNESFLHYSGVGNASPDPSGSDAAARDRDQWAWLHPALSAGLRQRLHGPFYVQLRAGYAYNHLRFADTSRLLADDRAGVITGARDHGQLLGEASLLLDTRDDEVITHCGQFHQLEQRWSPLRAGISPHRYGQTNLTLRFYFTPVARYLTVALRAIGDLQYGDVPFYELARIEDTFAFGGPNAVRGIPGQRYYGKLKAIGNVELRSELLPFRVFGKDCVLGVAAFFDGGRVWSGYRARPALDGRGLGLKYGIGLGPRLVVGEVLVVRADVAWSPDADPLSAYFLAGEVF